MRRPLRVVLVLSVFALFAFAQEEKKAESPEAGKTATHEEKKGGESEEGEGGLTMWKWANFLLLAGLLGYGIGKGAPAFFATRSQQINKDMAEAQAERQAAEERAAAVDRRLSNLEVEIAALRADAQKSSDFEAQRQVQHTTDEIAKIQAHAEQEIVAAGKAARLELKRHASDLAVGLAEQKIRARLTPETQDALVQGFVRDLQ